jgi:glutaminase
LDGTFTLMSAVKPFLLLRALEARGPEFIWQRIGQQASTMPYYSLRQLLLDQGRPRNSMINSGAMVLASLLTGPDPLPAFQGWLRQGLPDAKFEVDTEALSDVLLPGADPTNLALAKELQKAGALADAEQTYEVYFSLCCIKASARQVARLAQHYLGPTGHPLRAQVLQAMATAGLYQASEAWMTQTASPAKSAVSGMMFAMLPRGTAIAACSPWLDPSGNPILPMAAIRAASALG